MDTIQIKFKCAQSKGQDEVVSAAPSDTFLDIKMRLLRAYPLSWPRARTAQDMRLIFGGQEVADTMTVSAVRDRVSGVDQIPIHLIVRERTPSSPMTPVSSAPSSPLRASATRPLQMAPPNTPATPAAGAAAVASSSSAEGEAEQHFHAVTVSERELAEFKQIFDRKKGPDGRIACNTVRMVLQSYWRFIHREGFEYVAPGERAAAFPQHRLEQLCRKVGAVDADGMTLDQFLTVFYLFDNAASEEPCVHGERERVRMATAQLHAVIQPSHEFYHERFDEIYALVCGDQNGHTLTCKEMELLYYMYSVYVLDKVKEEELVARVQAIVRMRLQANKYQQLVDAARTLQCAWRMRMFASDRSNHERIAQFLRQMMMAGQDKVGGPRDF